MFTNNLKIFVNFTESKFQIFKCIDRKKLYSTILRKIKFNYKTFLMKELSYWHYYLTFTINIK